MDDHGNRPFKFTLIQENYYIKYEMNTDENSCTIVLARIRKTTTLTSCNCIRERRLRTDEEKNEFYIQL